MLNASFFRITAVTSLALLASEGALATAAPLPAAPMPGPGRVGLIAIGIIGAIAISRSGK